MPDDRKAADALANKRAIKRLERTALLKWASTLVGALGIEAQSPLGIEEPAPVEDGDPTDLDRRRGPPRSRLSCHRQSTSRPQRCRGIRPSDAAVPVGAGSNGKAQR